MTNSIWVRAQDIDSVFFQRCADGKISLVSLEAGAVKTDGSFECYLSKSTVDSIRASYVAKVPNGKVLAWVYWRDDLNLSTVSMRQKVAVNYVDFIVSLGFDGVNDDICERYVGSDQNWVDVINDVAVRLKNLNLNYMVLATNGATYKDWRVSGGTKNFDFATIYGGLKNVDYATPMLYDSNNWLPDVVVSQALQVLENSSVPVLLGLMVGTDSGEPVNTSLNTVLATIKNTPQIMNHPKFKGLALWMYLTFKAIDWASLTAWNNIQVPIDGGEEMAKITFNGTAKDKNTGVGLNNVLAIITVTKPDGSKETVTATTTEGAFSTEKTYITGNYQASCVFTLQGYNTPAAVVKNFSVAAVNGDMVVTFDVAVA